MTVCFFAYREFKGISFDIGQGGGYGMGPLYSRGTQSRNDDDGDNERTGNQGSKSYNGGSTEMAAANNSTAASGSKSSGFKAF
eukprot:CAMPEP_0176378656 /NCGR_PEP_ID=MMETSP0126-20121128/29784_1 /TAXON_ID=141414 ORGANISM="Strombidinopsis acuminatum, Strain SPMC142" /NCGR_SAMPLE_ID=MMETSP0126 /ASSEMBLY_ACC=CAM_ASM_000229 /LENGTH=82 /DNA_ID=CAMNT_0017741067 /DNA_START=392 /DNA_END=640 /DNA_ORIENTATION=+